MQVTEQQDGRRRCVYWDVPDQGWEDAARQIDSFLASAIQAVAKEHAADPVAWLVINHWPTSGRLIVVPAQDLPGDRGERIYFDFQSVYLENEFYRITETVADDQLKRALEGLGEQVWERVADALRHGQASRRLAEAREGGRFRLAMFDYDFGEGLFHLPELDEEAAEEMRKLLGRLKPWYGAKERGDGSRDS